MRDEVLVSDVGTIALTARDLKLYLIIYNLYELSLWLFIEKSSQNDLTGECLS